jgi:hypothetical protein
LATVWDDLMKMLVRAHPQDFVSLVLQGAHYLEDITSELKVRSIEADFLCKADRNGEEVILHVEFQRRHDSTMGRRMWEYNCVTSYLTQLPVCSFVMYLRKDEPIVEPPYKLQLADGSTIHIFYYGNLFLWEVLPETLKQKGLEGMLPLLPLTKGADLSRDAIVGDMIEGLRAAGKDDVLALGYAFAGLVYEAEDDRHWLKRRFEMFHDILEGSWSYQEMVQKGINIGLEQGELKALRPVLLRIVETRFPELLPLAQQAAERMTVPVTLSILVDRLLLARTLEQARLALQEAGSSSTDSLPS